ncbi:hypothetical protein ABL78_0204 [Leptomonas seymouri]|uniref:Uncharacterized protein n=1 Tax=Leptomonas seymouri TaxID=5684 RepID=A0A0N1PEG2_LEPSE|nr:hypothetical protein ABL78_0204 [Leptomonas seymouri]|eukprot:KPI90608.1 hypothetical protein ABL78_0204 [Leptomonas seymouri]
MSHDRERAHRSSHALVKTDRSAVSRANPASSQVERYAQVDERTRAKTLYQRDGQGNEMYAAYYNSNDDPTFQERYNTDGNRAFVTTSSFTFVSNGGNGMQWQQRAPTAVVEEETSTGPGVDTRRFSRTRDAPAAQPIVEEPDDDSASDYVYTDDEHKPRRTTYDTPDRRPPLHHPHSRHGQQQPSPHYGDESDARQLMPFADSNRMMRNFFMDDFFSGPRDPFGMMDAMRQHMSQQRAAMFRGVDPFANFF